MLALEFGNLLALESGIVLRSIQDQNRFYAFNVVTGEQFRLNRTSFWILEEISDGIEWTHLRTNYLATYDISPEQGEVDLIRVLSELYNHKVIRRRDNGKEES